MFVIVNATAIKDKNGNFRKSRSTAFNITDRHLAEEKVIEANKELEAFTYSVSHDLRAPLRSIDGYSKILQEDYSSTLDREANRLLQIIRNNAHRMGHLIDDLLDFSRMGRKELDRTIVDMNALVGHVRQELISHEVNRKIEFTVKPLKEVQGDLSMMRQVWINLISNALKYSRKQQVSRIEIGCKNEDHHIVYYIQDNGVGFDMKYSDKLFGVFQRLHKIEEFDGTGVGLALVHRIVFTSWRENLGRGSFKRRRYIFLLYPFTNSTLMVNNIPVEVLLIEDNNEDAELTIRVLKKHNLANNLVHLQDGEAALDFLFAEGSNNVPRLILLDLKMPKVDGIEVLRKIKTDEQRKMIPVVMLTSSKEERDIIESYKLGVNAYVVKPVEFEKFVEAVAQLGLFWLLLNQPSR